MHIDRRDINGGIKMSKGLEALKELSNELYYCNDKEMTKTHIESRLIIEKELKLLAILKKYLCYYDSWYENQAQYDYEHIYLRMENSPFANDEEKEDLIKVKEWLKNES